jgi:hypothetical protein
LTPNGYHRAAGPAASQRGVTGAQSQDLRFGSQIWIADLGRRTQIWVADLGRRSGSQFANLCWSRASACSGQPCRRATGASLSQREGCTPGCILSADRAPVQAAGSLSVARPEPACRSGRDWSQPVAAGASLSQPQPAIRTSPSDKLFVILAPASQMHQRPSAQLRSSVERRDATQQQVVTTPTTPPTTALQLGEKAPSHPPSFVLLWSVGCDQPSLA